MRDILPLISSGTVGPLGLCHLPRLWAKTLLHVTGHLPAGYRHGAGGIDDLLFRAVGLDADEFAAYIAEHKPTYLELETWVRMTAKHADRQTIDAFNQMLRSRTKPAVQLQSQYRFIGIVDETIRGTILVNDLDDWTTLHAQVTTGQLPFIAASLHSAFSELLVTLRRETGAARVTIRVDLPAFGFAPTLPMAEALRHDAVSALDSVHAGTATSETIRYLLEERRALVQTSVADPNGGPASHGDFTDTYSVRARMIGPVFAGEHLAAWISVHDDKPRTWTDADVAALERATAAASEFVQAAQHEQPPLA